MTREEVVDLLNNEADWLPGMTEIFTVLQRLHADDLLEIEEIITLIQAAFWTGVEAGISNEYAPFREKIRQIAPKLL